MPTYTAKPPTEQQKAQCQLCRDGWARVTSSQGGHAFHELPEPAGSFRCEVQ